MNAANCRVIDISKAVNAGFRLEDEDEDDEDLLIPDQGAAENDLRNIPVGRQSFMGVPFSILDPNDDQNDTCIQLDLIDDAETIRVNARYSKLFFLHTALKTDAGKGGQTLFAIAECHQLRAQRVQLPVTNRERYIFHV